MRATLHDICRRTGLSTATVSRVVNNSALVHPKTRERVQRAIKALGYHPSHAARTLARQRADTLGVIFPEIASGFYTELLRGIDDVAIEHNFHLMTAFSHSRQDERELLSRMLREGRVDALILLHVTSTHSVVKDAAKFGRPIVTIGAPVTGRNILSVSIENAAGARAVATHLLEHGFRRVAVISGPKDNFDAVQRLTEFTRAFPVGPEMIWPGAFTEASGQTAVERWLTSRRPLPEAIVAGNDAMAIGALGALRDRGYRVPEDVALVGFDDVESARHLALTTVRVPMRQMGHAAAEAAIQQLLKGKAQRQRMVAAELVVRRSCGCDRENIGGDRGKEMTYETDHS